MRCRACDSTEAHYIHHWEDFYCDECLEAIQDAMSDDVDEEWEYLKDEYKNL